MAQSNNGKNGSTAAQPEGAQPVQVQVVAQYIKDLSFESPNIEKMLGGPGENPQLKLEVNVNAAKVNGDVYESLINFNAKAANNKIGTIYELEIVYGGMFRVVNMPDEALEQFLLINCPTITFPFLRRLVADITREGGFPPLLLDPIDFAGLYVRRQQEIAAGKLAPPKA